MDGAVSPPFREEQRQQLEGLLNHSLAELPVYRRQLVLLSAQGYSVPEIRRMLLLHPINVRK